MNFGSACWHKSPHARDGFFKAPRHLRRVPDCKICEAKTSNLSQELRTLTSQYALPADAQHDVAANGSVPAYTLFPHAALLDTPGMQCSVAPGDKTTLTAVTTCTRTSVGACCVNLDNLQRSSNSTAVVRQAALMSHSMRQACGRTFQPPITLMD